MKKLLLLLVLSYAFTAKAQNYYSFSQSTGTYSNLTGATILANNNWIDDVWAAKIPFPFKSWGDNIIDSIYIDDLGSISISTTLFEEIALLVEDLNSRGAGKSPISYKVEGATPNRIFKVEYQNVGFGRDNPGFADSANVQCWFYETSSILEYHYGPNMVKSTTWKGAGPYVGTGRSNPRRFIILEGNPASPVVNTKDTINILSLIGMPANGTIYRFTPSNFPNGISNSSVKINVMQNKISLPASLEVNSINIYNANGQLVQMASNADEINFSNFARGLYIVAVETKDGILTQKLVL